MIELLNIDCMKYMKTLKDNAFDLAIVDPPYGLGDKLTNGGERSSSLRDRDSNKWDILPKDGYFKELYRVSVNQIVWGSNYFKMPVTRCNIIWDKIQIFSGADFELAWTSFDKPSKAFRLSRIEAYSKGKIHPTQKPVKLYDWLLKNYAKEGDRILDTHLGSGSSAIAAHYGGFDFVGCELDTDYFNAAQERFNDQTRQRAMF